MKRLWNFFSSITLTIVLAVFICIVAAWGSLFAVREPEFYRALDGQILLPWLLTQGPRHLDLTLWIYLLIVLTAVFAINTAVCTLDRLYSIIKLKKPFQAFFPQIVHIGFLIALLGHLAGSVAGFRSYGTVAFEGEMTPVPYNKGMEITLDDFKMESGPNGEVGYLRATVSLYEKKEKVRTGDIEINGPLIHKGIAFYHLDQGRSPEGLILGVGDQRHTVKFEGAFTARDGREYRLGQVYPDFALDEGGRPYSRTDDFRNPHVEVISSGSVAYLDLDRKGGSVVLDGTEIKLLDYKLATYVVLAVHKDPGIWLIITGSIFLVIGMVLLLFMRGERGEIVRQRG